MRSHSHATKTTTLQKYRIDKTHPKNPKITVTQDLKDGELKTTFFLPRLEQRQSYIPKKRNASLIRLRFNALDFIFYTDTEKCFLYNRAGDFIGSLEKHDLKELFSRLGLFLRDVWK